MAQATHKQSTAEVYQNTGSLESALALIQLYPSDNNAIGFNAQGEVANISIFTGSQWLGVARGQWLVVYSDGRPARVLENDKFQADWVLDAPESV